MQGIDFKCALCGGCCKKNEETLYMQNNGLMMIFPEEVSLFKKKCKTVFTIFKTLPAFSRKNLDVSS
jgi:hypothetical protein